MADYDRGREGRRALAGIVVFAIVAGGLGLVWWNGKDKPVEEPEPVVAAEPAPEPVEEAWVEPAPEIVPAPQPVVEEEPVIEEVAVEPVACQFPGDGFVQYPHGFVPTDQYVEFDAPYYESGFDGAPTPLKPEDEEALKGGVCVMLLYDISVAGKPINISILETQPASPEADYYEAEATRLLATRTYAPGRRNDKPVRIDNNFLEIRFEPVLN